VTLRRLLDHTSGIKGLTEMPEFGPLSVTSYPRDSALALIKRAPFEFAPGEAMIYNNSAFWLLGLVIEKASGMSYEDYVEQKMFAPLGMTRSRYCHSNEVVERRAHGYGYRNREVHRAPMNVHTWPYSAGSLCSTAGDMVTWLHALHGGKVLSPASYKEMITPSKLNDGTPLRYSMGLAVGTDGRGLFRIGHGGGIAGFVTEVTWYPDSQLAVVVLMNSAGPVNPAALGGELAAEVLPWKRWEPKPFAGQAAPLTGTYKGPSRGREMTVVVAQAAQGITVAVNGQPARPVQWVEGQVFRDGNTYITFKPNEVRWDQGGGLYVLKKQP
jgi:CubicO group peptidase (beta-lactamase class C family)